MKGGFRFGSWNLLKQLWQAALRWAEDMAVRPIFFFFKFFFLPSTCGGGGGEREREKVNERESEVKLFLDLEIGLEDNK